ncbi:hypothetical protein Tco_0423050, partial [Tanacetum coccineum]
IQMVAMMSNPKRENVDKVYKEDEEILRNVKVEAIDTVDTNAVVHGMQQVTKAILLKLVVAITIVEAFINCYLPIGFEFLGCTHSFLLSSESLINMCELNLL